MAAESYRLQLIVWFYIRKYSVLPIDFYSTMKCTMKIFNDVVVQQLN